MYCAFAHHELTTTLYDKSSKASINNNIYKGEEKRTTNSTDFRKFSQKGNIGQVLQDEQKCMKQWT